MVLDENIFIEQALRMTVLTGLSDEDLEAYRMSVCSQKGFDRWLVT